MRNVDAVSTGWSVLRTHGGTVGHLPRQVGERRHELRHGGLAVDEAGFVGVLDGHARRGGGGEPETTRGGRLWSGGPRLRRGDVLVLLVQVSGRHPRKVFDSHRWKTVIVRGGVHG